MPITTSAKKALRRDRSRTIVNRVLRTRIKTVMDAFEANPSPSNLVTLYSILDQASKHKIMHHNKAGRLKSRFAAKVKHDAADSDTKSAVAKPAAKKLPSKTSGKKVAAKPAAKKLPSKTTKKSTAKS